MVWRSAFIICLFSLVSCGEGNWNNPYPKADRLANTFYASFDKRPKHLDPAQSYSSNEYEFIANIYMPPLQYHYLKRPYTLIPFSAADMPKVRYIDAAGDTLASAVEASKIAFSESTIKISEEIQYQPHPVFAKNEASDDLYHD